MGILVIMQIALNLQGWNYRLVLRLDNYSKQFEFSLEFIGLWVINQH